MIKVQKNVGNEPPVICLIFLQNFIQFLSQNQPDNLSLREGLKI